MQSIMRRGDNLTSLQHEALKIAMVEMEKTIELLKKMLDIARADHGITSLQIKPLLGEKEVGKAIKITQKQHSRIININLNKTMATQILLIEDEVKLAQFIEMELSCEGYEVSLAHDGLTGLTLARQTSPDLIILDWTMPGMSGIEICRRLRSTGIKVPILLLPSQDKITV